MTTIIDDPNAHHASEALQSVAQAVLGSQVAAPPVEIAERICSAIEELRMYAGAAEGEIRILARVALGREPSGTPGAMRLDAQLAIEGLRDALIAAEADRDQLRARVSELETAAGTQHRP